jgi:hypothetical protein
MRGVADDDGIGWNVTSHDSPRPNQCPSSDANAGQKNNARANRTLRLQNWRLCLVVRIVDTRASVVGHGRVGTDEHVIAHAGVVREERSVLDADPVA